MGAGEEEWHSTVIVPRHILENSPSRRDGVPEDVERKHRAWGCELIQEAGILLRMPQVVMCTGQTLLQRFFYRQSLIKFDAFSVAMGCMLLASKLEESMQGKRVRDILNVFHRMSLRRRNLEISYLDAHGLPFKDMREEIVGVEGHLLRDLGFSFYNIMDHPHKFILYYAKVLSLEQDATQRAWNYLNDALRTDMCLRFAAETIACAAIYMSCRSLKAPLPQSPPWWELFKASPKEMGQICNRMLELYRLPKLHWIDPLSRESMFEENGPLHSFSG